MQRLSGAARTDTLKPTSLNPVEFIPEEGELGGYRSADELSAPRCGEMTSINTHKSLLILPIIVRTNEITGRIPPSPVLGGISAARKAQAHKRNSGRLTGLKLLNNGE